MSFPPLTSLLFGPPLRVHLIGVAGSGMSGIAALVLALGHRVSGSDRVDTIEVRRLQQKGLHFSMPHTEEEVTEADLVIYSSAVCPGNVALDAAQRLGKLMVRRAEALAAIMGRKKGIVVCGMHGKTTTSSMAAHVLKSCGLKPSHYVGAEIPILGTNACWDAEGDFFVAEGDESDGTLTHYQPEHAIVLNIELEHLDFYKDIDAIDRVYHTLIEQTNDRIIYCADDPGSTRVCAKHPLAVSYGTTSSATYRLTNLLSANFASHFTVWHGETRLGEVELNVPGAHNACNALAVIALATELGVPFAKIAEALAHFRGARRRFEIRYRSARNIVVDDYGHHPTEIAATLATARTGGWKRTIVLFQPHRYSRTQALAEDFGRAFGYADLVYVADVYPASEPPIPGISGQTVVDALVKNQHPFARFQPDVTQLQWESGREIQAGDLILTLGAGNIHEVGAKLAEDLACRDALLDAMQDGIIRLYEPLSKHTTLRTGGPAQFWAEPETIEGFTRLVRYCSEHKLPFMVMGRGSNLLVRDGGIPGVVACLQRGVFLETNVDGSRIYAGAGVRLKQLVATARNAGLGNFEWMEGIPGSLGGALRMNAGAMGQQMFEQILEVQVCDDGGNLITRTPQEMEAHYRNVPSLKKEYAVAATLKGTPDTQDRIEQKCADFEAKRRSSQPVAASAGCIFKNHPTIPAGQLVEELGLKNRSIGQARVSDIHGNFIVNDGGASAQEILTLIEEIKQVAHQKRGIQLETEVQIVGVDL